MGKKTVALSLLLGLLFLPTTSVAIPALANSAAPYVEGVTASGTFLIEGDCPLQVTSENLTFDLQEFPSYFFDAYDVADYTGKVKAEYTFYNPEPYAIRAKMLFPFGGEPSYFDESYYDSDLKKYFVLPFDDTEKYAVSINGEAVEKRLRYTWSDTAGGYEKDSFDVEKEMQKIHDDYLKHSFYTPETPVYKYTYTIQADDSSFPLYLKGKFAFDKEKTNLAFESADLDGSWHNDGYFYVYDFDYYTTEFTFYVFGENLSTVPTFSILNQNENNIALTEQEQTTVSALILQHVDNTQETVLLDAYNAFIKRIENWETFGYSNAFALFERSPMRWCEYEMEVGANATATNAVTVPIYPTINNLDGYNRYNSYTYTYLLSPAQTWSSFENLTIKVHTPYTLTQSVLDGFEKTKNGYSLHLNSLPNGELHFTLRDPASIKKEEQEDVKDLIQTIIGISVAVLVVGGIVALVVVKKVRKKKDKK